MADSKQTRSAPSTLVYTLTFFGVLPILLFFLFLLLGVYIPNRPKPATHAIEEARLARLVELRSKDTKLANSYEWIDMEAGIVRIPTTRAMELTVNELSQN